MAWKKGRRPPPPPRLTQRALLAHGVLVLEGVVGELRRVVRGRVTVAGRPVEGYRAVSCGRGRERNSVSGESGTLGNRNPARSAQSRVRIPRQSAPREAGSSVTSGHAPRPFPSNTQTSPEFPNLFTPLSFTASAASAPNLASMKTFSRSAGKVVLPPKQNSALLAQGQRRATEMDLLGRPGADSEP